MDHCIGSFRSPCAVNGIIGWLSIKVNAQIPRHRTVHLDRVALPARDIRPEGFQTGILLRTVVAPDSFAKTSEELASGELMEIPTALAGTTISAVCAHHKSKWLSPLMKCFIRLCREATP